jgi:hypothetical protein
VIIKVHLSGLSTLLFLISYPFCAHAQTEPLSGGVGAGLGGIFQLSEKTGNAANAHLRIDGRIPLLAGYISINPNFGWEYAITRVESNNAGKTLQNARAQYLRWGSNIQFRLYTSKKQTGIEMGGGVLLRNKIYESSDWQLTGGQPITHFPKSQMLIPLQLSRFAENDKRRINIFAEVQLQSTKSNYSVSGVSAGIQWQWYAVQRKKYFKGTHRTLQWDDVWPAQPF